jgi:hypothetical protein
MLGIRATLASGLLLGLIMSLVDSIDQPLAAASFAGFQNCLLVEGANNCLHGLCWAFLARWLEPRFDLRSIPGFSLAAVGPITGLSVLYDRFIGLASYRWLGTEALASHVAWMNLFYGTLYVVAFVSIRKAARSRQAMSALRVARDRSLAEFDARRLDCVRGQVQPDSILKALETLRAVYRRAPEEADDLLDLLVAFLRQAVRGLTARETNVASELELTAHYLNLQSQLGGNVHPVSIAAEQPMPEIPFPPGLLMPLTEHLLAGGGRTRLEAGWQGAMFQAVLSTDRAALNPMPPPLRQRVETIPAPPDTWIESRISETADAFSWRLRIQRRGETSPLQSQTAGAFPCA